LGIHSAEIEARAIDADSTLRLRLRCLGSMKATAQDYRMTDHANGRSSRPISDNPSQ